MGQAQIQGDKNWCFDEVRYVWKPINRAQFNKVSNEIKIGLKLRNVEKVAATGEGLLGFSIVMI